VFYERGGLFSATVLSIVFVCLPLVPDRFNSLTHSVDGTPKDVPAFVVPGLRAVMMLHTIWVALALTTYSQRRSKQQNDKLRQVAVSAQEANRLKTRSLNFSARIPQFCSRFLYLISFSRAPPFFARSLTPFRRLPGSCPRSRLVANISHELRTPMNAICGYVDMMLLHRLSPRQREWAEIIKTSADALLSIVNVRVWASRRVHVHTHMTTTHQKRHARTHTLASTSTYVERHI
jgi:signal transduction histidine kinase